MTDYIYWLLREYGEYGTITHLIGTSLNLETGLEIVNEDKHEVKMVLLPVSLLTAYAQQVRSSSDYGNYFAQGNSLIALPTPGFEVHQDDIIDMMGFKFRILDINHLHKHHILELVVRGEQ